ncbi:RNA-binding protein 38 [Caerostris darwini]|uniref:RNA-binding protein 38 n=1 Tax=Caerostris darwini TaxID=1538125 RepID=A0AAV4T6F0_9ARAC|nr:RNA-binding protein 38 [Caerostris darwini]
MLTTHGCCETCFICPQDMGTELISVAIALFKSEFVVESHLEQPLHGRVTKGLIVTPSYSYHDHYLLNEPFRVPQHYLYPSTFLQTPGLILSGPAAGHAPLSPAAAAAVASPFYTEYAATYPPQFPNGLEVAGYAPFAAATLASTSAGHHHPHTNGAGTAAAAAALPPYLPPAAAHAYTYALQPPSHHQAIPTGAPAHFPVSYPAQPQDARMQ